MSLTRREFVAAISGIAGAWVGGCRGALAAAWRRGADAPTRRSEVAAAVLGGRIFVVGGFGSGTGGLVEAYDPAADRWERHAPLPVGLHHTAAVAFDNRLFVAGGYRDGWTAEASVFAYDPTADRWQARRPMPTARGALTAVVFRGQVYAFGGAVGWRNSVATEAYDPIGDTWQVRAPLPTGRDHHAAAVAGDSIYVIGGRINGSYSMNLGVVEAYAPDRDTWRARAPMPTHRSGIGAALVGGGIYVVGARPPVARSPRWRSTTPRPTGGAADPICPLLATGWAWWRTRVACSSWQVARRPADPPAPSLKSLSPRLTPRRLAHSLIPDSPWMSPPGPSLSSPNRSWGRCWGDCFSWRIAHRS
jgi:hypothetical protein